MVLHTQFGCLLLHNKNINNFIILLHYSMIYFVTVALFSSCQLLVAPV